MASSEDKQDWLFKMVAIGIVIAGILLGLSARYNFTINKTESLNFDFFITDKSTIPTKKGQYVEFNLPENKYFPRAHWTKRIVGVPGDVITVTNREIFINGKSAGIAKSVSSSGTHYYPIAPQTIPEGYYYLKADHENSYDSRYQSFGLVSKNTFIGRDYPVSISHLLKRLWN